MPPLTPKTDWPEAMATVLSCTYTARAGRAIAFGLPSGRHYSIRYNYWSDGALHQDQCFAEKPIPQGSVFPIRYDPGRPQRNHHAHAAPPVTLSMLVIAAAGSLVLCLLWLFFLRGCA